MMTFSAVEETLQICVYKPQEDYAVARIFLNDRAFTVFVHKFIKFKGEKSSLEKAKVDKRYN